MNQLVMTTVMHLVSRQVSSTAFVSSHNQDSKGKTKTETVIIKTWDQVSNRDLDSEDNVSR